MKAMILAAGRGKRMGPLTQNTPKPLLRVNDKALIDYHLSALADAGISEVVINNAYLGEQIIEHVADGAKWGLRVHHVSETDALETAGGIVHALPFLGDTPFLLINADVFTDFPIAPFMSLIEHCKPETPSIVVLVDKAEHTPSGDFSRGSLFEDSASLFYAISENQQNAFTFSGISMLHPSMFAGMKIEFRPLGPILKQLAKDNKLLGLHYSGMWRDIGTPERLAAIEAELTTQ